MPIAAISSSRLGQFADVDELVDVALFGFGHAEPEPREPERFDDLRPDVLAEVAAGRRVR